MNLATDTINTQANFETYLARMSSVDDKKELVSWVPFQAAVLDFGCADGSMADSFPSSLYAGYDCSEEMVEAGREAHPGYHFFTTPPDGARWDRVLFSSVLHEVYSYSGFAAAAVVDVLQQSKGMLSAGGSILIRDGLAEFPEGRAEFLLHKPDEAEVFFNRLNSETEQVFDLSIDGDHIEGRISDIAHFLNIITWGTESFEREKNERVNFASAAQWKQALQEAGFVITRQEVLTQPDYFAHLSNIIDLDGMVWPTKILLEAKPLPTR